MSADPVEVFVEFLNEQFHINGWKLEIGKEGGPVLRVCEAVQKLLDRPNPTSIKRLDELIGLTEEMTTGGSTELTLEQANDIHAWLQSARPIQGRKG
jgi:hypothetical protein